MSLGDQGEIIVDDHCRAADPGVGDRRRHRHHALHPCRQVPGRIVADTILGRSRSAHYDGIPRVVFADPEIAAAGLTQHQADQQGAATVTAEMDLPTPSPDPGPMNGTPERTSD